MLNRVNWLMGGAVPGLACVLLGLLASPAQAQPHLVWASRLVHESGTRTSYRHTQGPVTWRGAIPGGVAANGSTIHRRGVVTQSHTDCSGMLSAVMRQGYRMSQHQLQQWLGASRPLAVHYHDAIVAQRRFQRISHVQQARAGNIVAIRYDRTDGHGDSGHIMILTGPPRPRHATPPVWRGTRQWEAHVIDQTSARHGPSNTRPAGGGIGQGTIRIYASPTGAVIGYCWSTQPGSTCYRQGQRHLVIGRFRP